MEHWESPIFQFCVELYILLIYDLDLDNLFRGHASIHSFWVFFSYLVKALCLDKMTRSTILLCNNLRYSIGHIWQSAEKVKNILMKLIRKERHVTGGYYYVLNHPSSLCNFDFLLLGVLYLCLISLKSIRSLKWLNPIS